MLVNSCLIMRTYELMYTHTHLHIHIVTIINILTYHTRIHAVYLSVCLSFRLFVRQPVDLSYAKFVGAC